MIVAALLQTYLKQKLIKYFLYQEWTFWTAICSGRKRKEMLNSPKTDSLDGFINQTVPCCPSSLSETLKIGTCSTETGVTNRELAWSWGTACTRVDPPHTHFRPKIPPSTPLDNQSHVCSRVKYDTPSIHHSTRGPGPGSGVLSVYMMGFKCACEDQWGTPSPVNSPVSILGCGVYSKCNCHILRWLGAFLIYSVSFR